MTCPGSQRYKVVGLVVPLQCILVRGLVISISWVLTWCLRLAWALAGYRGWKVPKTDPCLHRMTKPSECRAWG